MSYSDLKMEKLPNEIREKIFRQLTPQDLARCSAVCHSWYDMMNEDWIWAKICDQELEEPLRTVPCVITPKFEIPMDNTLSPSPWKLAFLREKHLWNNWRPEKTLQVKQEDILEFENETPLRVDFFTDTLIVLWYSDKIVILDVSVTPAVVAAKTNSLVRIESGIDQYAKVVVGTDLLFVQQIEAVEVFKVDVTNKSITLKYSIGGILCHRCNKLKANFYFFVDDTARNFKILDLNLGKILKEEPYPGKVTQNKRPSIVNIHCSPTSEYVQVFYVDFSFRPHRMVCFVYSLKQLGYLPGPELITSETPHGDTVTLHDRWGILLRVVEERINGYSYELTVFYISQNEEVLIHDKISISTSCLFPFINVCNGWFVFFDEVPSYHRLKAYSPSSKTVISSDENFVRNYVEVINNKVIASFRYGKVISESVWKPSSEVLERFDFTVVHGRKTNQSFTKVVKQVIDGGFWYILHLW